MDKEKLTQIAKKAKKLQDTGNLGLASEFIELAEKQEETIQAIKDIPTVEIPEPKEFPTKIEMVLPQGMMLKGEKGDPGDDGKDYVLTEKDRAVIASKIKVPIVEKIVELTEVIHETPIVTNEIMEVAVAETAEQIRDKLESLKKDNRLDKSAIKGLSELLDKSDRAISILDQRTQFLINKPNNSTEISNITGLITAGSNVTITGSGTLPDPYVINSSGGSGSPAGVDYDIQLNASGSFGAVTGGDFTYDYNQNILTAGDKSGIFGGGTYMEVNGKTGYFAAGDLLGAFNQTYIRQDDLNKIGTWQNLQIFIGDKDNIGSNNYLLVDDISNEILLRTNAVNINNAYKLPTIDGPNTYVLTTDGAGIVTWQPGGAVTSITGTANQIIASASTGAVTLSTPQDIATSSTPQFARLGLGAAATADDTLLVQQAVSTSGSPNIVMINGAAHTTLTASTEASDFVLNLARTVQFSTGALTKQTATQILAPTYSFVGASTISDAATLYIDNAPTAGTNATITRRYAIWADAGRVRFDEEIHGGNGGSSAPTFSFVSDTGTGFYRVAAGRIGTAISGTGQIDVSSTYMGGFGSNDFRILHSNGLSATVPTYGFFTSTTTGMSMSAANTLNLITNATTAIEIDSAQKVSIGGQAPLSTLDVRGSFSAAYVAKTANYTATVSDYTIECTANTFDVTLPTAVGIAGRVYVVANSGAGTITIKTTSSQTFVNVAATPTTLTLAAVGSYMVQSNGANWLVIN